MNKPTGDEAELSLKIADAVLNRVNADPDDDSAVLARQLMRRKEETAAFRAALAAAEDTNQIAALALGELEAKLAQAERERDEAQARYEKQCEGTMTRMRTIQFLEHKLAERDATIAELKGQLRDISKGLDPMKVMVEGIVRQMEVGRQLAQAEQREQRLREGKDRAYLERNQVVAALAKCFPSGVAKTAIEGWDEEWHGCVYIDLPTGQVSWHYHDSHAQLFAGLPPYTKLWDGHTTEEKYQRVAALARTEPSPSPQGGDTPNRER